MIKFNLLKNILEQLEQFCGFLFNVNVISFLIVKFIVLKKKNQIKFIKFLLKMHKREETKKRKLHVYCHRSI